MNSQSKRKDSRVDTDKEPSSQDQAVQSYKRILVCYDGSDNAMRALQRAIQMTKGGVGGELSVVVAADTLSVQA